MKRFTLLAIVASGTLGCSESYPLGSGSETLDPAAVATSAAVNPLDVAGIWSWEHHTIFVIPTPVAAAVLPPTALPHLSGPIARIRCHVAGVMNLSQTGSAFDGTSSQSSSCHLPDGPEFAWPFVYNPSFVVADGQVNGRSIRFSVPPLCTNRGSLRATSGVVTGWKATGSCAIPIPDRPAVAKTITWEAWRP